MYFNRDIGCALYYSVILIFLNSILRSRKSWKRLLPSNVSCLKSGTSTGKSYSSVSAHTHMDYVIYIIIINMHYDKERRVKLKR